MVSIWRYTLVTLAFSSIYCKENVRRKRTEHTKDNLELNIDDPNQKEVVNKNIFSSSDARAGVADDIIRRFANFTFSVRVTDNNDTAIDEYQSNIQVKAVDKDDKDQIKFKTRTLHIQDEFKPKILRAKIKPVEKNVTKIQLKIPIKGIRGRVANYTRSAVINKSNNTLKNKESGIKIKVRLSKKQNQANNKGDDRQTQFVVVNDNDRYTTKNLIPALGGIRNNSAYPPIRNVPGFNIESKSDAHFKAKLTDFTPNNDENVQFLPVQYHVPVMPPYQVNQAPLPPILPPPHTYHIPVYQSDDLPLHFHASDPMYSSHLDTISQGNLQLKDMLNYFKLRDNNRHSEMKAIENDNSEKDNFNTHLYQRYGVPIPRKFTVNEGPVHHIGDTRRTDLPKNEEFVDAHIKIPKNLLDYYQSQLSQVIKAPIDIQITNDTQFSQKAGRELQASKTTNLLGIDTLINQLTKDPGIANEQTENLFPKIISLLGPEFSTYFGQNPIPADQIDNQIQKLQNTLETLRKLREISENNGTNKTNLHTTNLPVVTRTHIPDSESQEFNLNNLTLPPVTRTQMHRDITTTLNENATPKSPNQELAEFLSTLSVTYTVPDSTTSYVKVDTTTKHLKTTMLEPNNKTQNTLLLEINEDNFKLEDGSVPLKKKQGIYEAIKKSLDRFTLERKKTPSPKHSEIIQQAQEDIETKEIQPYVVKDIVQNRTMPPNIGLIGKVLNENYKLLSHQLEKKKASSKLPETIELQGNDEDIIDPKYISENPEVFDTLRQQTEMMGKLLLNYKKHTSRKKSKVDTQNINEHNMEDFEDLINKLQDKNASKNSTNSNEISTKHTRKQSNSKDISRKNTIEKASNEVSTKNKIKTKYSKEVSTENKNSNMVIKTSHTLHLKNSKEIATANSTKDIHSKESSNENEKAVLQTENTLKNKMYMRRSELKKVLLRNPDLQKILHYCQLQKNRNKNKKRKF